MTTLTLSTGPTLAPLPRAQVLYLPSIHNDALSAPQGQADDKARRIFWLMCMHEEQQRFPMEWNETLARVAYARCVAQAHEGWAEHVDPDGYGPNWWVRRMNHGYLLPYWYSQDNDANNIESLAHAGDGDADTCWQGWLDSPGHRIHVLGTDPFYAAQVCVGVGYYYLKGSEYGHYWSIISAPKEQG